VLSRFEFEVINQLIGSCCHPSDSHSQ